MAVFGLFIFCGFFEYGIKSDISNGVDLVLFTLAITIQFIAFRKSARSSRPMGEILSYAIHSLNSKLDILEISETVLPSSRASTNKNFRTGRRFSFFLTFLQHQYH